jgi:hypothetical protein
VLHNFVKQPLLHVSLLGSGHPDRLPTAWGYVTSPGGRKRQTLRQQSTRVLPTWR